VRACLPRGSSYCELLQPLLQHGGQGAAPAIKTTTAGLFPMRTMLSSAIDAPTASSCLCVPPRPASSASTSPRPRYSLPSCLLRSIAGQHAGAEAPCGHSPPASPSTAAGCSSAAKNPRNGTLGEPTPLPHPFAAEPSLPLARIELPPPAMAPGTQLQSNFPSRQPICEIRGHARKIVSSRSR
jgi:hypothetical protein